METELRPRFETANWALATTAGWIVLWIATRDATYFFPAFMCFALFLQCRQRLVVDGRFVQRVGLRPVVLDLSRAHVVHEGVSWWRELFFAGRTLQLQDADGHRLYLESWLWPTEVRDRLIAAASA